jgi:hypothetical protein
MNESFNRFVRVAPRLIDAMRKYGDALNAYIVASGAAYNVSAEVTNKLVNAVLKNTPIDLEDLQSEAQMCMEAGRRAGAIEMDLRAQWKSVWGLWKEISGA